MESGRSSFMQKKPKHVAIVMDGNGRWAEARGLSRIDGHNEGVKVVKKIVKACFSEGVSILSIFAFSVENWSRPSDEVDFLMQLFIKALAKEVKELHANGVRIKFIGSKERISIPLQKAMDEAERKTQNNDKLCLNVAVNYSGKWDIVNASKVLATKVQKNILNIEDINEENFHQELALGDLPDPDLFIRTSGEIRISNFFLWQLAYSELYFTNLYWPDFTEIEFKKALQSYKDRERRFGKTSKQIKSTPKASSKADNSASLEKA